MGRKFNYIDMMRSTPARIVYNQKLEKHSEMLKPYKHDGYQEMEHWYPDYNFDWDFNFDWDMQFPRYDGNLELSVREPQQKGYYPGKECDCWWYCLDFMCFVPATCSGHITWSCDKYTLTPAPLDHFSSAKVIRGPGYIHSFNPHRIVLQFTPVPGVKYGIFNEEEFVVVELHFRADSSHGPICYWAGALDKDCNVTCKCSEVTDMTVNELSSSQYVTPGQSCAILVSDGCAPYTWTVTGTGYSFDNATTDVGGNVLRCASGVCGTDYDAYAKVTVTDSCGVSDTWIVLTTTSAWTLIQQCNTICTNESRCQCDGDISVYPAEVVADEDVNGEYGWTMLGCNYGIGWTPPHTCTHAEYSKTITSLGSCPTNCAGGTATTIANIRLYRRDCS